eukprot:211222_1
MCYFKLQLWFTCTLLIDLHHSEWQISSTLLPNPIIGSPIGFYNGDIYFIDGDMDYAIDFYNKKMIKYNIINDEFSAPVTIHNESWDSAYSSGFVDRMFQSYWTQSGNILYTVDTVDRFDVYNMNTNVFSTNWMNIGHPPNNGRGCLTSTTQYLFSINYFVSRLDFSTYQWWSGVPSMNSERIDLACIIDSNDMLYAIAGISGNNYYGPNSTISSIERISINSIQTQSWTYIDSLTQPAVNTRAVIYKDFIFVIGGMNYWYDTYLDTVHVIDGGTGTVTLLPDRLPWPIVDHSPVVANNILYVFGGKNSVNTGILQWAYTILGPQFNLSTIQPTLNPTISTIYPTVNPTIHPSVSTIYPTISTIYPTVSPTVHPSISTIYPTVHPSIQSLEPTNVPSKTPTFTPFSNGGINCGLNKYCYHFDVSLTRFQSTYASVYAASTVDNGNDIIYDFRFYISHTSDYACYFPRLTIQISDMDFDSPTNNEFLDIYHNSNEFMKRCGSLTQSCNPPTTTCYDDYYFGNRVIERGEYVQFTMIKGAGVNKYCGSYSLVAG